MKRHLLKGWGLLAPLTSISLGLLVFLLNPVPVQVLRNAVFDQYQRWQPRNYQAAPVHIIDVDEESLKRLGQWPWPRTRMAELTIRLQKAGASAIAFDILFAEPDRTSPKAMLSLWQPRPSVSADIAQLPDHDAVFASAIAQGQVILGFSLDRQAPNLQLPTQTAGQQSAPPVARYITVGEPAQTFLHDFSGIQGALPLLQADAAGQGALTFVPDSDGVIRRVPLVMRVGSTLVSSLSAEALRVAQGAKNYTLRTVPTQGVGMEEIRIGRLTVPTTPKGEIWVHYTLPVPQRYIPAWKVLAGDVAPELLQGQILLVGSSAQGLMDLRFSPMGGALPGVEVHAQMLEQVLSGVGLQRPSWATAIEALVIVLGGAVVGLVALASGALVSSGIFAIVLAGVWSAAWHAFSHNALLLDPVVPSVALALSFVLSGIVHHLATERRQAWVRRAFSRYVSPNLVTHLIDHPEALELGGKRQTCSFVFTDLSGFTSLMEKMDPAEAVSLLNDYLDKMIAIAFSHEGTLDRIVGDAVAIMFSAPVEQPDHPQRALACALEMQRFAAQYDADLHSRGVFFGQTRIGVHSGEVIVGNFGGGTIFDYRALGDAVNTASRLEGANKQLGTMVCVSQATLAGCPDASVRPVGRLLLKGKTQPLMAYEPLDASSDLMLETSDPTRYLAAYEQAYGLMCNGDEGALAAFLTLGLQRPQDALVQIHIARLQAGARDDVITLALK